LAIKEQTDAITFQIDAVLTPGHSDYREPGPSEQYCYRKGHLKFTKVTRVAWKQRSFNTHVDATGEEDLGNIDSLTIAGPIFTVEGDWGIVEIETQSEPGFELDPT